VVLFDIPNEKNHQLPRKLIPVVKGLDSTTDVMLKFIEDYMVTMPANQDLFFDSNECSPNKNWHLAKVLFTTVYREPSIPISQTLELKFKLFPHYLRHCRLTHMAPLGILPLIQIAGWSKTQLKQYTSGQLLETYIRSDWQALVKIMILNNTT
jgi:hypothetical protein